MRNILSTPSKTIRLLPSYYPFMVVIVCFSLLQLVLGTFLTTFTLSATGSETNVKLFNMLLGGVQPIAMIAAVVAVRRWSALRAQQIGLFLLALMNAYLLAWVETAANHILLIAVIQSVANGFYYTTYACQFICYTTNANRDMASGLTSAITNTLSLVFSIGSSVLFCVMPGSAGYRVLFFMAFAMSLIALAASFRLAPLTTISQDRKIYYFHAHRVLWTNKWARTCVFVSFLNGILAGVNVFLLNMLLYSIMKSEALVGFNTFLSTLCSIVACGVYARTVCVDTRYRSACLSILVMIVATLLLAIKMNPVILILYSAINAAMQPFFSTPLLNAYWTVLEALPELRCCRPETHAAREIYYGLGRILGIIMTFIIPSTKQGIVCVLLILMCSQYIALRCTKCIMRDLDHIEA